MGIAALVEVLVPAADADDKMDETCEETELSDDKADEMAELSLGPTVRLLVSEVVVVVSLGRVLEMTSRV